MTNQITIIDSASSIIAGQGGQSLITGNPSTGSTVSFSLLPSCGPSSQLVVNSYAITVSGLWTGTLQFEASEDGGTTWVPCQSQLVGIETILTRITQNGVYKGNAAAFTNIRIRAVSAISGAVNINFIVSNGNDIQSTIVTNFPVQQHVIVDNFPITNTGISTFSNYALTNTAVDIKTAPGAIANYAFVNRSNADAWIQFFDLFAAQVILGVTIPKFIAWVPQGGAWNEDFNFPLGFLNGISCAATTTPEGSSAPSVALIASPIGYI